MKTCKGNCGETKDESYFGKDARMKDDYRGKCKVCVKNMKIKRNQHKNLYKIAEGVEIEENNFLFLNNEGYFNE